MPDGGLRPVEGLASAAFLLAGALWLLALPFAFASGWAWAIALAWGALSFVMGLPFALVAVVQSGRATSRILVRSALGCLAALAATLGLTWLLVQLDVL